MRDDTEWPAFIPLWQLIRREKIDIGTLASAIEEYGIEGWDRFGRFDTFKADSADADHLERFKRVLNALAAQHAWDEVPDSGQSPLDGAEDYAGGGHPFEYGWLVPPNFSAIVARRAGQPVQPQKKPSKRAETSDLNIIAVMLTVLAPKAGYESEATLIGDILDLGYGDYDGISKRTLENRFRDAKKSLTQ